MSQYFRVINLDNPFPVPSMSGKFPYSLIFLRIDDEADRGVMNALWQRNKRHKAVIIEPLNQLPEQRMDMNTNRSRWVLPEESLENGTLPTELFIMILEEVEDLTDMVCLVLTCQRYYEIGRPILEARFEELLTHSWAGDRLICAGDGVSINDLPQDMLTEDEVQILDERFARDTDGDNSQHQLRFVQSLHPAWCLNTKRANFHDQHKELTYYFAYLCNKSSPPRLTSEEVNVLETLTEVAPPPLPEYVRIPNMYKSHVLRNLTTREYIRGDAVHKARDRSYLGGLCLSHLLILRIIWAADPSPSAIESHRGVWAGHRFDFTDIGTVQDHAGRAIGGWKDVSKVVIDEFLAIDAI
ncbi:hypothetical protein FPV67DRAFT_1657163 [Lyophyllum atratum]|nr:hypothetical protein FPV67DRAFT_1657163 [Lyophyllum atratum]